jgi:putative hydrolase of the HAD superfamily
MRNIMAVIFDLDDTLISEKEYIRSGFKVVSSKISQNYNLDSNVVYKKMIDLFKVDTKNVFNRLLDSLNIKYSSEYINNLIDAYRSHIPDIKLYEDADYIIKYLYEKGIKLGIITDGYKITQRNKLKALNIDKYFDCVIVTDELGKEYWKPHRKSYDITKDILGIEYEEMIYVGDNIIKDFITPNKLGINTVLISREEGIYSDIEIEIEEIYKPNHYVTTLRDIKKLIDDEFN